MSDPQREIIAKAIRLFMEAVKITPGESVNKVSFGPSMSYYYSTLDDTVAIHQYTPRNYKGRAGSPTITSVLQFVVSTGRIRDADIYLIEKKLLPVLIRMVPLQAMVEELGLE